VETGSNSSDLYHWNW